MRFFDLEPADSRQLAQELLEADALAQTCCAADLLGGSQHDLPLLQQIIECMPALDTAQVRAIAAALGRVLLLSQPGSEWAVVQGVQRRGLAIRRIGTLHWISPEGALRSHLHGQAATDLQRLHASMLERLNPPALAA
ncbi:MAG: hypothetical protein B7Z79_02190 [Thiomonas sp. 20-64-9]|nr:MAG: hypothetical protein B7Z79_02190 [Thiomonas sp. 20-64-9]